MTTSATHIFRLLRWGRTLARHGALRLLEQGYGTPAPVRRLFRLARFGTFQPSEPDYSRAFQAIGPAAIKLGQALASRQLRHMRSSRRPFLRSKWIERRRSSKSCNSLQRSTRR